MCWCGVFFVFLLYFSPSIGRVRTKQPLSTASSVSSQVDSRGRSRTKMVSQSQRMYSPIPPNTQHDLNPALSETFWVIKSTYINTHTHTQQQLKWRVCVCVCELLRVCSFSGSCCGVFITCCPHGDDKLHVNVFVPSGSDESDCTPGILFVCQSVCVCVCVCVCLSVCTTVGMVAPPAIALIPIKVFCKEERVCFLNVCVFLCMLCLITEDGVVDSLFPPL